MQDDEGIKQLFSPMESIKLEKMSYSRLFGIEKHWGGITFTYLH